MYIYMHTDTHTRTHTHVNIIHTHLHTMTHTHTHTHTYTYTRMRTHTHTHTRVDSLATFYYAPAPYPTAAQLVPCVICHGRLYIWLPHYQLIKSATQVVGALRGLPIHQKNTSHHSSQLPSYSSNSYHTLQVA